MTKIIGKRTITIETPASTLDPIKVRSVIERWNDDGSYLDHAVAWAEVHTMNHQTALMMIGNGEIDWKPEPITRRSQE